MKILFVLKQRNYMTTFGGVVDALAARGHAVRLAWPDDDLSLPTELSASTITVEQWPHKRSDEWATLVSAVRRAGDYLRYLDGSYASATKLRARAFEKLLHSISRGARHPEPGWSETGRALTSDERARLASMVDLVERAIPSDPRQDVFIEADRPDVVLVSPLIDLGSAQTDVVKSAKHLGIPTGMILYSWDNLSTKGGLHVPPDRMFVWNELQRAEAETLHGYSLARTVATGAPRFDDFLRLTVATSREHFLRPLDLDPARPTLVYLGSSKFVVTASELPFIRKWIRRIRTSPDEVLRACNVIVRPHPDVKSWEDEGPVQPVRWPGIEGKGEVSRPFDDGRAVVVRTHYRRAQAFFDTLHHSAAVVGLNTSASLEAAIVGRPVFTILAGDEHADGQQSTLHFRYLLQEEGGCVSLARDFDEHVRQLTEALAGPDRTAGIQRFAMSFVRPMGVSVPASGVLACAIEREFSEAAPR
jgi:hypothetical protein